MGRRDAVQAVLEVVARCRQLLPNLLVTYEAGWETRGNGTSANYEGGLVHHTASASSLARPFPTQTLLRVGRSDLPGPLCNFAGPACTEERPRLHVMAAFPANHAGASGGRSMGPLPRTSLFNPRVMGLEIDYAGSVPMLGGQMLVAQVWARAVADVLAGGNIEFVRAHYETSITGKWDIGAGAGSVNMNDFRRQAAARGVTIITPVTEEDDMPQLISHFVPAGEEHTILIPPVNTGAAGWGPAWVSLEADTFGHGNNEIVLARIMVRGRGGVYRPLFPPNEFTPLGRGERPGVQLQDGDSCIALSALHGEFGVGVLVEYGPRR